MSRAHRRLQQALLAVVVTALAGCLRMAQERALLDLEVGAGTSGGVTFTVEEGLAAIRQLRPGHLELWAQAPVLAVQATAAIDAVARWSIVLHNSLPDSTLVAPPGVTIVETSPAGLTSRGWTVELPPGTSQRLVIGPREAEAPGHWRFAVVNDIHATATTVPELRELVATLNSDSSLRFVLSGGDLTMNGKREEFVLLQRELAALRIPLFATIGNHDTFARDPQLWHELIGRHSIHFAFRGIHFTLVDSASVSLDPLVYQWLERWLAEGQHAAHLFITHLPILDPVGTRNAAFRARNEAGKLLAKLTAGEVDLIIQGHIHSYYAYTEGGIPAIISAVDNQSTEALDGIERNFMRIEVEGERLAHFSVVRLP